MASDEATTDKPRRIHPEYEPAAKRLHVPPAQINLFTGEEEPVRVPVGPELEEEELHVGEGITLIKSGDTSQLIISGFGAFMGKTGERLTVKVGRKVIYEFPFFRLSEVSVISRGVTLSSDLLMELCQRGVQVNFLHGTGKPYAKITSPMLSAVVKARREQIGAMEDERGARFAVLVVANKIANQAKLLRYCGKYLKTSDSETYKRVEGIARDLKHLAHKAGQVSGGRTDEVRNVLMGIEGTSGRLYWEGVQAIVARKVEFFGRVHRGATDRVNALLNYGYGILYSQVWGAVITAGLEPFVGFLHVDRPGKPSLVLDLVEEFRQPVVDRTVISHINLGERLEMEGGLLNGDTRKLFSQKVLERLESRESYQGKKYQIRSIIQIQARNLASFLRREREYRPFGFRW
ncbi:MAG: CRISPR-associated endonuclease Cas1 [Deltaproteobacteria bacterium]|nr:CRISPR-associated endonuclease Cas1 [Deltaproteobacteria bacterium]